MAEKVMQIKTEQQGPNGKNKFLLALQKTRKEQRNQT